MLIHNLLFLSAISLFAQNYLNAAAGEPAFDLSRPNDRGHSLLCAFSGVPEDRIVSKIPSKIFFQKVIRGEESKDYSDLLAYLKQQRGSPEKPFALAVMPIKAPFGKKSENMGEATVFDSNSPMTATLQNTAGCYIEAACAIAQQFPDMVGSDSLKSYLSMKFQSEAGCLYDIERTFFDLFIPHFKKQDFKGHKVLFSAKEPQHIVALYVRSAGSNCIYKEPNERLKMTSVQLATWELLAAQDQRIKSLMPKLYEHKLGDRFDKQDPSEDLAEYVELWLKQEREYMLSKGFDCQIK